VCVVIDESWHIARSNENRGISIRVTRIVFQLVTVAGDS